MAMTSSRPTVLIGFGQAFAAIEVAWSLQAAGMHVIAFTRRGTKSALRHVRGVLIYEVTAPEKSASQCLADIEALIARKQPDAVMPLDDASLWLTERVPLGDTALVGPDRPGADLALDKSAQVDAARRAGIPVPDTRVVASAAALAAYQHPIVIKPSDAVRQAEDRLERPRGGIAATPSEFDAVIAELDEGPFLVQPFVPGTGEGIFGYVDESGPVALSAHRRVRMVNPHGSASSACTSIDVDPTLAASVDEMLRSVGWSGVFMVEFLRDRDGVPWFMELNGRAWGSLALARRRGYEYPAWATQYALGIPRTPGVPSNPSPVVARHLGRELAHLLFVMRGPQSEAMSEWPKLGTTVRDMLKITPRDRLYNWKPGQARVLVGDTTATLTELIRGRRRTT